MRRTITLDADVAAAIDRRRRETGRGLSEVVNNMIRAGLRTRKDRSDFRQRTTPIGLRVDVANVAEAIGRLDGLPPA
jgi:metal-responsive CopG/Arc/MetJ family transcriptional regulator